MELPENLLADRRPRRLARRVERYFEDAQRQDSRSFRGWTFRGTEVDYRFYYEQNRGSNLVKLAKGLSKGKPVSVLDIGAGIGTTLGAMAYAGGIDHAIALGATIPRHRPRNIDYIAGSIETRATYEQLQAPVSLILSRFAFMHLADPVGSLELAANCLAPEGLMCISQFIPNVTMGHGAFVEMLHNSGISVTRYVVNKVGHHDEMTLTAMRTSEEPIRFPLSYAAKTGSYPVNLELSEPVPVAGQ